MKTIIIVLFLSFLSSLSEAQTPKKTLTKQEIYLEASKQQKSAKPPLLSVRMENQLICASSTIPSGWIKTNDMWNPTICGKPTQIVYNVIQITRFNNRPINSTLEVCASATVPIPDGWVKTNSYWSPTTCGHPTSIVDNVNQIQRIQ